MVNMILDVDTGIDDALAIAYALASPEIELLGITVTCGNTELVHADRNTREVLKMLGREDIPVYTGAVTPLKKTPTYEGKFHGLDGLGEVLGALDASEFQPRGKSAADFIVEQAQRLKQELTIVTTGPLTNLALALQEEPRIVDQVGRVVSMGGAVMCPGNRTRFAEANIWMDPQAASAVFQSKLPITLVGLDVTRRTLLTRDDVARWQGFGTKAGEQFAAFTTFYLNAYANAYPYLKGCALHDPLAVGVAKMPGLVTTVPLHIQVELEGEAVGRTTEDLARMNAGHPRSEVCVQVDAGRFMDDFFTLVDGLLAQ